MSTLPGTPLQQVYDFFLSSITADDWMLEEDRFIIERDWRMLLLRAINRFERPYVSLELDLKTNPMSPTFVGELGQQELILLSMYMKLEWIQRCIADWRQIRQLYSNKEFSQANHLDKLIKLEQQVTLDCFKAQRRYRRSYLGKTYNFATLAGKGNE